MLGLKNALKDLEGVSLGYRLKHTYYELKYAWQRAWRGYDDAMVFNIDYSFVGLYKEILGDFKENLHGYPGTMTEEEWDGILNEMTTHLDHMYDYHYDYDKPRFNIDYEDFIYQCHTEKFFKLFAQYFDCLWS